MADWVGETGYQRNTANDTEAERRPACPQAQKTHADSTGFTKQCADVLVDDVMERAVADRMKEMGVVHIVDEEEDTEGQAAPEKPKDDDDLEALRARRRQQMKETAEKRQKWIALGHGNYEEIEEEAFLKTVTESERAVVHFYHRNFERCKIMDMHLQKCAKQFIGTKFAKLDAEKAHFFVAKLAIKTLPCVVVFVDGIATGRQLGFEGLPGGDEFKSTALSRVIREAGGLWKGDSDFPDQKAEADNGSESDD